MKKRNVCVKAIVGLLTVCSGILFTQMPASADNPIVQNTYTADPAPMAYGDTLYLYTSHDEDELDVTPDGGTFYTMNDWKCYSTKDMVNWTDHGTVLDFKSFTWADTKDPRAWAPQCVERDGKFYMYVPIHKAGGGMDIGVGVSDSPTGPFVDAIGAPLIDNGSWDNIDPTVFVDNDGQAYLYFGNPKLMYVKLNEDMLSYDESIGKKGIMYVDMTEDAFGEKADSNHKTSYGEAPWFYRRGDLYYMLYAGFTPKGGAEHLAYSTSDSPEGPWEYRGIFMPTQTIGNTGTCYTNHPGVVDFMGRSYMFYHNQALPGGGSYHRSVCVEEFTYNEDGTLPEMTMTKEGPDAVSELDPYVRTEAETFAWGTNVETEVCPQGGMNLSDIKHGSSVKVRNVDFGEKGAIKFHASVASDGTKKAAIELRLDDPENGEQIGTVEVTGTGGTDKYETLSIDVNGAVGVHDLYLVFTGEEENAEEELFKFDYWQFEKEPEPEPVQTPAPSPSVQPPAATVPPSSTVTPVPVPAASEKPQADMKVAKVKGLSVKVQKGKKAKVTWKKVTGADGYEIVYSTDKKLKKGIKKSAVKKAAYTVKKLKKGKKYFVKVRAYKKDQKGKKVYGSYSSVKKFKA